jgi:hypothetical protein
LSFLGRKAFVYLSKIEEDEDILQNMLHLLVCSSTFFLDTSPYYATHAGLEFTILLPQSSEFWNYRQATQCQIPPLSSHTPGTGKEENRGEN